MCKSHGMPNKPSKPHDEFFKATFGRLDIALDYLQNMLPEAIQKDLDLSKLERVNGSFVSPALQEYFCDVVYQSPLKVGKQPIVLSFIFEHKSKPEPRPHLQLLRYMLDAWTEQLYQNNKRLNPIIPILVYHGRQGWKKRNFDSYFGKKLPESILSFLPRFDYIFTHVTDMSDEQILELGTGLLINTFLMLKHIHDPDFIMHNAELIFINLTEPHSQQDFIVLVLAYFYKNSQLAEEKIKHFIETLPKALNKTAMTTYDLIQNKGIELGIQIGIERERQRVEELIQFAQQKENELIMRAEEERLRTNKTILYLYQIDQKTPGEIALIVSKDQAYVEDLISNSEEESIADN